MNEGIVQIILAIIALLGTVITAIVAPYFRKKYSREQRQEIYEYVDIAVKTAEQILKKHDPTGKLRKEFVLKRLNDKGFKLTENDLNMMIEAAVLELNLAKQAALE